MQKNTKNWTVASAKSHFSDVISLAVSQGPQVVTRNGIETVVIVSTAEWKQKTKRRGSLAEFLASSPLRNSDLKVERRQDRPRTVKL
jgi:prevent-host-death family protein